MENIKVMILDDEPVLRSAYRDILEAEWPDVEIQEYSSGELALSGIASFLPDLLITDFNHPGLKGCEFVRSVRKNYPELRILVASTMSELPTARYVAEAGANDYIMKPMTTEDLLFRVKKQLVGKIRGKV